MDTVVNARILAPGAVDDLIRLLRDEGYQVIGPTVGDGAIVLDEITSSDDLPIGITAIHEPGSSHLQPRADGAWFGHSIGPQSVKRYLYPARETLVTLDTAGRVLASHRDPGPHPRYAFLGVRGCDVAALEVLDGVLRRPGIEDPTYASRRDRALVIAVVAGKVQPGDVVALHWEWVCERLTDRGVRELARQTRLALDLANTALRRPAGSLLA